MPMQETLDDAIQALENERLYDVLVQANRLKLLPKSWNDWIAIIFNANPPNPHYQFLRDAYAKFAAIQSEYSATTKTVSDNDIFYKFEKELGTVISNFLEKYKDLGGNKSTQKKDIKKAMSYLNDYLTE